MESMAYTVRQVAGLSGVSIRTLHFYDEMGLLKAGLRQRQRVQVLRGATAPHPPADPFLQGVGSQGGQEHSGPGKATALESRGSVLEKKLARTQTLLATIHKTIEHIRGTKKMGSEEMFSGFRVTSG